MLRTIALVFCLLASPALSQNTVDVPIDQARGIARQALLAGDFDLALRIANGLLEVNPDDRAALLIVAAGAPRAGNPKAGRIAGARAFALAETSNQRYEAARLTALAASREERFSLATIWLRRALVFVPNEQERERTLRDGRLLRRQNPWSTNLSFSIVPSRNVNGGADENEVDDLNGLAGTLSADALALEGIRATLNFSTGYRFHETERDRGTFVFQYQGARVRLNDETVDDPNPANDEQVELDSSDFSSDYAQISLRYDRVLENGTMNVDLSIGAFTFGGERQYNFRRVGLSRAIPLGDPTTLFLSANRELQIFDNENIGETVRTTLRSSLSYRLENGDRITGTVEHLESDGDVSSQTFDRWGLEAAYRRAEPIGPVSLSATVGVRRADYPVFFLSSDGDRQDESVFYGVNLGLPNAEYAGFTPLLNITGSQTDSNVGRFTRSNFSVGLTLTSAF